SSHTYATLSRQPIFYSRSDAHPDLLSFPTRRSSDLGTRYFFGYNRPAGWATGKEETNSTWTVPVYGNQTGEPCHATAFKDSWCQDRKSTRLNSSHVKISYAVFCLKKKKPTDNFTVCP